MPTSLTVCAATSNRVSSGSNFLAELLTAGSTPGGRRSSPPSDLSRGLGRIAAEFCATIAQESANVDEASRELLGEQLMDILALALRGEPGRQPADEKSIHLARLGSIKAYIESNLGDPNLSLATIAKQNGISLRYLHQFFRLTDISVSDGCGSGGCKNATICSRRRETPIGRSRKSHIPWASAARLISAICFAPNSRCGHRMSGAPLSS